MSTKVKQAKTEQQKKFINIVREETEYKDDNKLQLMIN